MPRSQVSFSSTTPFPQMGAQFGSVFALQPDGQHWSSVPQTVIWVDWQYAVQLLASPSRLSVVQGTPSSHEVGQAPC